MTTDHRRPNYHPDFSQYYSGGQASRDPLTPESPDPMTTRLIGVELTYVLGQGREVKEEIAMFVPPSGHIDLPLPAPTSYSSINPLRRITVTLHCSDGDHAADVYL